MSTPAAAMLSVHDVPRVVLRHRWKSAGFFLLTMAVVVAVLLLLPPKYRSEASLFVRVGRESVTLDPTVTTGQIIGINESREIEINSILEILKSRALAERVVDEIGTDAILGPELTAGEQADSNDGPGLVDRLKQLKAFAFQFLPRTPVSEREMAVDKVDGSLNIPTPKMSTVVTIQCRSETPQLAQRITATLVEKYLEEHVRLHRTPGSHEFFVEQAGVLKKRLDDAANALRDAKNEARLVSVEGERNALQTQISTIELNMTSTQAELAAAQARSRALRESTESLPERVVSQDILGVPNVGADGMQQQLYQLQLAEHALQAKYTPDHPVIAAIQEQVEQARKELEKQEPLRVQSTRAVNPTRQQLEVNLLTEQSTVASLLARAEKLAEQHQVVQAELQSLHEAEVRIADLERQVELANLSYRAYAEKLEQARIHQELESERISNVNIVQPATFVEKPVGQKKSLIFLAGLVVAVVGAVRLAIFAEQTDRSPKSAVDVEESLSLPVLVSVPQTSGRRLLVE